MRRDMLYWCYDCIAIIDAAGPAGDTPEKRSEWADEKRRIERLRAQANAYRKDKRVPHQRRWNGKEWLAVQAKRALETHDQQIIEHKMDAAMGSGEIASRTPVRLEDFVRVTRR